MAGEKEGNLLVVLGRVKLGDLGRKWLSAHRKSDWLKMETIFL